MRSMRSRVPEKSELAAQLKRYRYDAGLKGDEAGAVIGDPRAGGRKKDESALRWRKMRTYYDMMNPAKQRTLLDVARAMAEDF